MVILVDFDGTCTKENSFPNIGEDCPGAADTLRWAASRGDRIILYTIRSHEQMLDPETGKCVPMVEGGTSVLTDAINWFKQKNIPLWAVNYNPEQESWNHGRKIHGDVCIDDRNLGVPKNNGVLDWVRIKSELERWK